MSEKRIDSSVNVTPLSPEVIPEALPLLMPHIEEAICATELGKLMSPEHMVKAALAGEVQFLALWHGVEVLGIIILMQQAYPRGSVCHVFSAGIELEKQGRIDWIRVARTVEHYIKEHTACTIISVSGRRGWSRLLKGEGFHEESIVLHKEIER